MESTIDALTPARWAELIRQAKHNQGAPQQSAISELRALLDAEKSADDVARAIASTYEPHIKDGGQIMGYVCRFWGIYCEAVREFGGIPLQADRLADLLGYIARLPDVKRDIDGNVYWKDLPDFAIIFRESGICEIFTYIFAAREDGRDEGLIEGDWYHLLVKLLNATKFAAAFSVRWDFIGIMQFGAEAALTSALEENYDQDSEEDRQIKSAYTVVAATWILFAGARIYEQCRANGENVGKGSGVASDDPRWSDTGFSLPRWGHWKQKFQALAEAPWIDARSQEYAANAAVHMSGLE